jgi:RNA recognition motif-containing protein
VLFHAVRFIEASEAPVVFIFLVAGARAKGDKFMKIYIGNLIYNMTEAELSDIFSPFGKVLNAHIITDQYTRQSKNIGYIEMSVREHGKRAIAVLNGKNINNRCLVVREA